MPPRREAFRMPICLVLSSNTDVINCAALLQLSQLRTKSLIYYVQSDSPESHTEQSVELDTTLEFSYHEYPKMLSSLHQAQITGDYC